jgi:hypothetical protein
MWAHMKNMVYKVIVETRDAVLEFIIDAAKHMNNPTVLLIVSHSIIKWARLCIWAEGGYFELFL